MPAKKNKAKKTVAKKIMVKKVEKKKVKPAKKIVKKPVAKAKAKIKKIVKKPVKLAKKVVKIAKKLAKPAKIVKTKIEKKSVEVASVAKNAPAKISEKLTKNIFKTGEYVVYPSHGIGKVLEVEVMKVLGVDFSCYIMYFEKEKLTIKIPVQNAAKVNLRPLVSKSQMDEVFSILRSGVKKLKGMWSRRAQEYESKINSGDIILLAEVLRDLTRDIEDGDRSYSERIIYETAVARLAAEYAAVYNVTFEEAKGKVVITAKDKLGSEEKPARKSEDFDYDGEEEIEEEEEDEDEDEDEEEEDGDEDDDDERPRKKRK